MLEGTITKEHDGSKANMGCFVNGIQRLIDLSFVLNRAQLLNNFFKQWA